MISIHDRLGAHRSPGSASYRNSLARTRPAGDDDMRHRYLESTTANDLASAAAVKLSSTMGFARPVPQRLPHPPCPRSPAPLPFPAVH